MSKTIGVFVFLFATVLAVIVHADTPAPAPAPGKPPKGQWTPISDVLIAKLEADGQKIAWPGKTAGVTVDPATGDVFVVVAGAGIYKSSDHGQTFARCDDMHIGGRCETGAALQVDPNGKRIACFMLDGKAGMTLDGGKTWTSFTGVGRNWDYGAVDWSAEKPVNIFAMRHESGCELHLTSDAGQTWKKIGKDPKYNSVGIIDGKTLLTSKSDGGIFRSTDAGATWGKVADFTVTNHVVQHYKDVLYLVSKEGLITSTDQGVTWAQRGEAVEATHGPLFKDEKTLIVWGRKGILESIDAGATWKLAADLPADLVRSNGEWFVNVGWDPKADIFYCSRMSFPAYRFER